jgi:hypothetical protein
MATLPDQLRSALLLRSIEEADPLGRVIPLETREQVSRESQSQENPVMVRAQNLIAKLGGPLQKIILTTLKSTYASTAKWAWALVLGAFVVGWFSRQLGSERVIDILAFPLLGLIIWNVVVCSYCLFRELRPGAAVGKTPRWITTLESKTHPEISQLIDQSIPELGSRENLKQGVSGFLAGWKEKFRATHQAAHKLVFHLAALALALGMVLGMYAQGLRKEYRAAWESTFLEPPAVHRLFTWILRPASAVTGISLPDAATIAALRQPAAGPTPATANAAPFIHLWAASAALWIGLPRLLLIALAWRARHRNAPTWTAEISEMQQRYAVEAAGRTLIVDVIPVYFAPETATGEAIRAAVLKRWGGKTRVHFLPKMELGEEESYLASWAPADAGTVVAFSFASTPEQDVQGEVIIAIAQRASQLLVITDAFGFEDRHHALPEFPQRFAQRHAAWQRVIGENFPWQNLTKAPLPSTASS